jgi:hypothetical protein
MSIDRFTHALPLNTDRHPTESRLRSAFGTFGARIDRVKLGSSRAADKPSALGFYAITFPEQLNTKPHLQIITMTDARTAAWQRQFEAKASLP